MEQSRGKFGITEVDVFGPYRMPKPIWAYGLNEYGQHEQTPDGSRAGGRMEPDCDALWAADVGRTSARNTTRCSASTRATTRRASGRSSAR
jgi:hypothetical protein